MHLLLVLYLNLLFVIPLVAAQVSPLVQKLLTRKFIVTTVYVRIQLGLEDWRTSFYATRQNNICWGIQSAGEGRGIIEVQYITGHKNN